MIITETVQAKQHKQIPGIQLESLAKAVSPEDMEIIHTGPDILGYNIYNGHAVGASESGFEYAPRYPGFPRTAMKWPVTPEVLDWGVQFLFERYGLPSYITENGLSCNDRIYLDGKVHDIERIDSFARYLTTLRRAMENSADIHGYCQRTLTDNLEWYNGYGERFGLIFIDYPTGKRIPKDSFYWYQKVIGTGRADF